ncbi:MAG: type II toxin-antitoxin system VapC family toxin [Syntrophobacterales bacterium]|jgi:PIN domain nuclease of toxin-antitoxin system|nr:type II toxin-antitoxin system VapC family toxin [Syntrophobacterales bacterium]
MRLLLDTHILLWAAGDKLPPKAERYISDKANTLLFSPASIWEVVVKSGLGRPDFKVDPVLLYSGLLEAGYEEIPIIGRHTLFTASLPTLHKDPFDRILLAQAIYEGIPFLTADSAVARYPGSIIFVG